MTAGVISRCKTKKLLKSTLINPVVRYFVSESVTHDRQKRRIYPIIRNAGFRAGPCVARYCYEYKSCLFCRWKTRCYYRWTYCPSWCFSRPCRCWRGFRQKRSNRHNYDDDVTALELALAQNSFIRYCIRKTVGLRVFDYSVYVIRFVHTHHFHILQHLNIMQMLTSQRFRLVVMCLCWTLTNIHQ